MNPSLHLESVALCLGDQAESVVFVGGMVRGLLVTDVAVPGVRPTFDVDVILGIHSRADWAEWEPRLRKQGFIFLVEGRVTTFITTWRTSW